MSLAIILGLVGGQPALRAQSPAGHQVKIEEATQVRLKLMETLNSATIQPGQTVSVEVLDNVKVGEAVVIAEGASAWGTILEAEGGKRMGRSGAMTVNNEFPAQGVAQPVGLRGFVK